ncbi:MAG: WYL domain-containing protein [Clostridia bacterium]|nr:WYL domain-containing protein [Clostridia bacterium]
MSVGRLFEIIYLLLERKRMTAQELATRFEVSVRTIYRDVDALSSAGVPIYASPGKNGGVALMEHYVIDRAAFSEDEQRQLLTALQSLPGSIGGGAGETLSKLSALFRRDEPDWLQVDMSRWGSSGPDQEKFDRLKSAILEHRVLSFTYVSTYGQTTARRVLPARLVFKGQAWYLQGFCLAKENYRTFKITRILELRVTDKHFDRPLSPPPIEGNGMPAEAPFVVPVHLRFSPYMAYRVYDEFDEGCVVREEDGSLLVQIAFPEDSWLYGYLLSFGLGVEVLSPPERSARLGALAGKIGQANSNPDIGCQDSCGKMNPSNTQEAIHMEMQFCQSCGMPLTPDLMGSEKDGSTSQHYCSYCYQNGSFTNGFTMEEMIAFCAPMMAQGNAGMTEEQAKEQMRKFFPMLMRWKK